MTVRELSELLIRYPNQGQEVGFNDGEGHWCKVVGLRDVLIDAHDFQSYGHERTAYPIRECCEISDCEMLALWK